MRSPFSWVSSAQQHSSSGPESPDPAEPWQSLKTLVLLACLGVRGSDIFHLNDSYGSPSNSNDSRLCTRIETNNKQNQDCCLRSTIHMSEVKEIISIIEKKPKNNQQNFLHGPNTRGGWEQPGPSSLLAGPSEQCFSTLAAIRHMDFNSQKCCQGQLGKSES